MALDPLREHREVGEGLVYIWVSPRSAAALHPAVDPKM